MIRGRVQHGVILLEDPDALPEGTELSIHPLQRCGNRRDAGQPKPTVGRALLQLAGKARQLSSDASRNLGHYLYGHGKR